ncbi:leucine-rich repeat domain-containing protein [Zongyangia hominis]|uniref:Leucine-rich repeat protein n=1 Tax=Zongyangia hominis TaxID=2763677 RepID=A0A926IBC9_9FIRM|nr:leucine-rich repeat domain-containing protein [Zongyangia hominis]MBC8569985.1 leucine-rich repeat protein [Zongyangia hominis]
MADLQEELQRFLTARFGVDVKDAFVSCIQKIHKENQNVAALEQPMKDATQQVLDIREEVVTASQNAVQTADDAKTIARAAESSSSEALATAKNAKDESFNASGDAQLAMSAAQNMQQSFSNMELLLSGKVDGAFVENGYLYLTSNNEVVVGPLGPFSGTGGSGGAGGNNAVLAVSNTSGWLSKSIAYGKDCLVQITWSSLEDELPTGNGVMKVTVNGIVKAMLDIPQGAVTADLGPYLSVGSNAVRIQVSDAYENSRTINFNINAIEASMSSTFDSGTSFDGIITFTYVPVGAISKTVHILLDGKEIATVTATSSGRQMSYTIPAQKHGAHTLEAYFDATVNGQTIESNHLYYEIICVESLNTTPIIATSFQDGTVAQYTTLAIPFTVYDPANLTAEVELSVNGSVVSRQTVDRTQQIWSYRADSAGDLALEISCGSASRTIALTVTASEMEIEAETEGLSLYLSSAGRSNTEENPGVWEYGNISAVFSDFNFTSDGWQLDEDNIPVLRVSGDARLTIPVQPFGKDFRTTGKTIEIEFATRNVMNYDAIVLSCISGNRGISITPQLATLRSEQKEITTRYKENEHLRLSFVVEKKAVNRLIYCYINGIMSGVVQYPADDDFAQSVPVDISIGSRDAAIDLYCIRVYDNDLTRHQVLNNWIADTQVVETMLERYSRNHVFDAYSQIVISQLPKDLPYLVLDGTELPQYKGDVKTMSGYYTDPVNGSRSFTFSGAEVDVQGTSSQYYARKNYKIKFKGGFVDPSGNTQETYKLRSDSIPTKTFTFKADVASSEGANNVELARLYEDTCPFRTAPQKQDSRIRQGIDGFPIVVFWYDGENTSFIGKYNFNFDKATPEVFGFSEGDESWEILNNTSDRVLWKDDDYSGTDWQGDFEARYPKDYADPANLSELAAWLKSTDQSAATGDKLTVNRTFDGVLYTTDTAAYRLAKFKSEFAQHFEKDAVLFYYLFTELFLMVDSRAKNMFPTFMAGSKWFSLPYDFDTAIGINNEGALVFSYNLEDIDHTESGADIYNGQQSVLWINVRAAFFEDIKAMYQKLRSNGTLSFPVTEQRFEEHQAKWPEAVFNEDAYFKYLQPLVEQNTASYLSMLQGSKAEQRKWWLYNRFRYLDSKYNAGDALTDVVTLRGYAKDDITVTPYADIYATVKYGSYLVQQRANRNVAYTLACPLSNVNDTEIYIYSASQLQSIGDLSGLMVGYADFSMATRLQSLKVGDAEDSYSNGNLTELYLGNNTLLRTLDVRNCPNLKQAVDVSGCTNIEHLYFEGTAVTGVQLPNGGILKTLHLPGTVTNLTIRNQTGITDFVIGGYDNISTLRLENVSEVFDLWEILHSIPVGARVRVTGLERSFEDTADILAFYDLLDTMRGLDENGNNMEKAQVSGTFTIDTLTGNDLAEMQERYPNIKIQYNHFTAQVNFYDDSGSTLLKTVTVYDGGDTAYGSSNPTKASTAQYSYSFTGWSLTAGGSANANALKAVVVDRNVYAAYSKTVRKYTIYFYNGSTLLQTVSNVPYGSGAYYSGDTPEKTGVDFPEDYVFTGWSPSNNGITGNTYCYAQYKYIGYAYTSIVESSIAGEYANDRVTAVGDYVFRNCTALTGISLPSVESIGVCAFLSCTKLTSVSVPAIKTIYRSAFSSCTALTSIDLHGVTSIAAMAFYCCTNLTTVILRNASQVCALGDINVFDSTALAQVFVPAAMVDAYKADSRWSKHASKILAIEDYPDITGG